MKKLFVMILMLGVSGTVWADDSAPTVSDAHELIAELIGSGNVFRYPDRLRNYHGSGCKSSFDHPFSEGSFKTEWDWGSVYSITPKDTYIIVYGEFFFSGRLVDEGKIVESSNSTNFNFNNPVTGRRIINAMTLIMNTCKTKSKFD